MKTIKTYQQAREYLGSKKERPYAHNTRIEIDGLNLGHEVITVKYHGNPVVNLFPDGTITYNSCGWRTVTTKERINWFLPEGFSVYQERSVWYLSHYHISDSYGRIDTGKWIFADGIAIKNGEVYNAASDNEQANVKAQIKRIKAYVNGYVSALLNGEVPAPDGGDCWYCLMVTDEGKSLGDATNNHDHIESHLDESYYVPSLLMNAAKFRDMCTFAKDGIARIWAGESISEWQQSIIARDAKSSLTAYLKHVLNIAQ